jgi:hypothetical protein
MMPGLIELTRAPRSPQVTAAAWTRRWFARLLTAYATLEFALDPAAAQPVNGRSRASEPYSG